MRFGTILFPITTRTCTHGLISQTRRIFMTQKRSYQVARSAGAPCPSEPRRSLLGDLQLLVGLRSRPRRTEHQTASQTDHGHYTTPVRATAIYNDEIGCSHPVGVNRTARRQTLFSPRPFFRRLLHASISSILQIPPSPYITFITFASEMKPPYVLPQTEREKQTSNNRHIKCLDILSSNVVVD